jgi:EAL domain-containing protein (putative c-di-GMP-specific phosphodiesterase class I)
VTRPACDCERLHPLSPGSDLLIFSASGHVTRKLSLIAGVSGLAQSGPGWRLQASKGALEPRLSALCGALKPAEREQVQVVPIRDEQPLFWQASTLPLWLTRLQTAWFPEALGNLHFVFQPVFDLRSGAVFGHEALVRARQGEQMIGALELLSAAPAHGGLHVFDRQARIAAIEQGAALTHGGHLLINFMPGVVYDPEVCLSSTFAACAAVGVDPSRLIFEAVESDHFPDLELLGAVLSRYRREGMQVALDDLGAGRSSLLHLETLRPDIVKLDRSLMLGLTENDPRIALVGALIEYAHRLGVQVVVEGLETAFELEVAVSLGADLGQGYGLGRPVHERETHTEAASSSRIRMLGTVPAPKRPAPERLAQIDGPSR